MYISLKFLFKQTLDDTIASRHGSINKQNGSQPHFHRENQRLHSRK